MGTRRECQANDLVALGEDSSAIAYSAPEIVKFFVPENVLKSTPDRPDSISQAKTSNKKLCHKCGKHRSLGTFHKNKSKPDGLESSCKPCVAKTKKKARQLKKKRQLETNSFTTTVAGELDGSAMHNFSDIFAVAIRELLHDRKI